MRPGVNEDTSATLGAIRDRKTVYPRRITLEVAWERVGRIRRGDAAVRRSQFDRGNGHLPFVCSEGSCRSSARFPFTVVSQPTSDSRGRRSTCGLFGVALKPVQPPHVVCPVGSYKFRGSKPPPAGSGTRFPGVL